MGWGTGKFGASPWGTGIVSATGGAFNILSAYCVSTNSLIVQLGAAPVAKNQMGQGDALNPTVWELSKELAGNQIPVVRATMLSVTSCLLETVLPLGGYGVMHLLKAPTLLAATGGTLTAPTFAEFSGIGLNPKTVQPGDKMIDLRNAPVNRNPAGGTLQIGAGGDYQEETGDDAVKKFIMRRLLTPTGGFFHLPNYGIGLQAKSFLPSAELKQLRIEIERQIMQEPEVAAVSCSMALSGSGVLDVSVQARLHSGKIVSQQASGG